MYGTHTHSPAKLRLKHIKMSFIMILLEAFLLLNMKFNETR